MNALSSYTRTTTDGLPYAPLPASSASTESTALCARSATYSAPVAGDGATAAGCPPVLRTAVAPSPEIASTSPVACETTCSTPAASTNGEQISAPTRSA